MQVWWNTGYLYAFGEISLAVLSPKLLNEHSETHPLEVDSYPAFWEYDAANLDGNTAVVSGNTQHSIPAFSLCVDKAGFCVCALPSVTQSL